MNFVSRDGTINTKANYVCSFKYNCETIQICQIQEYIATYQKYQFYVIFWKNQKIKQRILLKKDGCILQVSLNGQIQALLSSRYLRVYFNKRKLITKFFIKDYIYHITFTNDNQIIWTRHIDQQTLQQVQIYDFITKQFCYVGYVHYYEYQYCPINNIILIQQELGNRNQIFVWGVPQRKIIKTIKFEFRFFNIKMAQSGQYLVIRDDIGDDKTISIFSFGENVTFLKKLSLNEMKFQRPWEYCEWIFLEDQIVLINNYDEFKLLKNNNQIFDCYIQKQNVLQEKQQQIEKQKLEGNKEIINVKNAYKQKIHIIGQRREQFIDHYSIIL